MPKSVGSCSCSWSSQMMYFGLYKNLNFALLAYQFVDDTVFVGYFAIFDFF